MPRTLALRLALPALLFALSTTTATAQSRPFWEESWPSYNRSYEDDHAKRRRAHAAPARPSPHVRTLGSSASARAATTRSARLSRPAPDDEDDDTMPPAKLVAPKILEGGPRPDIAPRPPTPVSVATGQSAGTVVIDTRGRQLFLMTSSTTALRYPVSVGRDGFTWTGTEKIARVADWPDWHPPAEMRERIPTLPEKMTGGIHNPLGAKSLYLGNSLYRIHGTNDARTIGQAASSGCFRMLNGHVVDLAGRVGVGTKVVVLPHLGASAVKTVAPNSTSGPHAKPQALSAKPRSNAG